MDGNRELSILEVASEGTSTSFRDRRRLSLVPGKDLLEPTSKTTGNLISVYSYGASSEKACKVL